MRTRVCACARASHCAPLYSAKFSHGRPSVSRIASYRGNSGNRHFWRKILRFEGNRFVSNLEGSRESASFHRDR